MKKLSLYRRLLQKLASCPDCDNGAMFDLLSRFHAAYRHDLDSLHSRINRA